MFVIYPRWKGLPVIPTKAAMSELYNLHMNLEDVVEILENGEPSGARRKKGTHEICLARKGKLTDTPRVRGSRMASACGGAHPAASA
ncbi:MAG: hypothetical protein AB1468_03590 [Candidatus Micrarchaeota archaeon]